MFVLLLIVIAIPAAFVVGGIVAFVMLPIKAGIAVAVLAFILAGAAFSWMNNSIDLSH